MPGKKRIDEPGSGRDSRETRRSPDEGQSESNRDRYFHDEPQRDDESSRNQPERSPREPRT
jgi:hypothetical protein